MDSWATVATETTQRKEIMVYSNAERKIPSKEWLAERNLKIVVDKHGHWHLEPNDPQNPNSGKKTARPPFRPLPLEEGSGLSPENGTPAKFEMDTEVRRKHAKKH